MRIQIPQGRITGELRVRIENNGPGQGGAAGPTRTHMMMAMPTALPAPTSLLIDSSISNPLTSANIYTIYSKTEVWAYNISKNDGKHTTHTKRKTRTSAFGNVCQLGRAEQQQQWVDGRWLLGHVGHGMWAGFDPSSVWNILGIANQWAAWYKGGA